VLLPKQLEPEAGAPSGAVEGQTAGWPEAKSWRSGDAMRVRCDVEAGVIWSSSLHPFLPPLLFFSKKAVLPFLAFLCCIREWALACGAGSRPKNLLGLGKFTWAKGGPEPSFASTGLRPWAQQVVLVLASQEFSSVATLLMLARQGCSSATGRSPGGAAGGARPSLLSRPREVLT
jgi:hypothetical protein